MELVDVRRPEPARRPKVPEHLGLVLHQVALLEVNHEASLGEASNGLQGVLQHLRLLVTVNRDIVEVYHYRKTAIARFALEDGLHHELEVRGCLR